MFLIIILFYVLYLQFPLSQFAHEIKPANRIVVTLWGNSTTITITNHDATKVVKAVSSAKRDFGFYKAQFVMIIKFYEGTNNLGEIRNCGSLFLVDDKQYRAEDLNQLVEAPFIEAYKKAMEDSFEKQSESK